ncbi:glycosyltransferase [Frondihabitans peucedani]|uniref:glycosyltransferase n=1 Tax=Frondihabitans peucedani TaxID=598626 RepID=UPI0031DBF8CB
MPKSAPTRTVAIIGTRGYPSYYGGFETAVRKIAPALADAGWDVTVYGRDGSTRDDDPDRDPRVRTRITGGVETKSVSTLSYGFTAVLDAVRRRPDAVLVMNVANGFWLPLLSLRGIPSLVNVDGIEWERAKWGALAKFVFKSGARFTARFGTRLVGDAREIVRRWNSEFGRDAVFIPYGGEEPGDLPVEEGLQHRRYVLAVARFVPENTISEFIDAARLVAEEHDVVIVGSSGYGGEFDERVERLAAESDRVTWLGHVSDDKRLLALWQHAGAYFHGHSVGGTNPALVQAMLCGAPIVARDTVYNREVLEASGEFVQPEPGAIAQALSDLLSDPARQESLSTSARDRARQHYTWEGVCRRYEEELASLVDSRRSWVREP